MNAMNRFGRLASAAGCLLWMGAAVAQGGPGGAAGGPSNGYSGMAQPPAASRQNTPTTGGGPTTQTGKVGKDEASSAGIKNDNMSDEMTGTISKVDTGKKTIELQGDRKLRVSPSTEIRRDGKRASFGDLQEGDDVRASFADDDRTNVKRIEVTTGSSSSTSPSSSSSGSSSSTTSPSSSSSSSTGSK